MNSYPEPIKNWFGFTRRERRSSFTLLIIIVFVFIIRYIVPEKTLEIDHITDLVTFSDDHPDTLNRGYNPALRKTSFSANVKPQFSTQKRTFRYSDQKRRKIELNSCDSASLDSLPAIGTVLSSRIIKYRKYLGGYAFTEQLKEVYGLSPETFNIIKDRVHADTSLIVKIRINTSDFRELTHIRYLDKYEISSILKYRQLKVRINSMQELIDNKILAPEKAARVGPYIKY